MRVADLVDGQAIANSRKSQSVKQTNGTSTISSNASVDQSSYSDHSSEDDDESRGVLYCEIGDETKVQSHTDSADATDPVGVSNEEAWEYHEALDPYMEAVVGTNLSRYCSLVHLEVQFFAVEKTVTSMATAWKNTKNSAGFMCQIPLRVSTLFVHILRSFLHFKHKFFGQIGVCVCVCRGLICSFWEFKETFLFLVLI